MACFTVPVAEAIITTIITKAVKSKEKKEEQAKLSLGEITDVTTDVTKTRIPFSRKMKWLNNLLWGGSALLAFEHIWHGEVVPWFPFLTAAADPSDTAEMLHEIATTGVCMAVLITAVWAGMLGVCHIIEKRAQRNPVSSK